MGLYSGTMDLPAATRMLNSIGELLSDTKTESVCSAQVFSLHSECRNPLKISDGNVMTFMPESLQKLMLHGGIRGLEMLFRGMERVQGLLRR